MLLNKGTITLADDFKAELGKAYYESSVNTTSGKTEYVYKLINLDGQGKLVSQGIQKKQVFVNGVNLAYGLYKETPENSAKNIVVDAGFIVESAGIALGYDLHQIFVTQFILG